MFTYFWCYHTSFVFITHIHWLLVVVLYFRSPCCDDCLRTCVGVWWTGVRTSVLQVVDTSTFEWVILVLIFSSSITLCFEDIYLDKNVFLKAILYWTNFVFCVLFAIEMLLKWVAFGFHKYFTSFWTVLDFIIVFVSMKTFLYWFCILLEKCTVVRYFIF